MRRPWLITALAIATVVLAAEPTAGCASAVRGAAAASHVSQAGVQARRYLNRLTRQGRFRGTVLVEKAGQVVIWNGFGLADVAHHVPDTPTTRFRIASLTKQFTAMAILQLQAEGRLKVTDRLCRFLTPCPQTWRHITVAELLTHTSGIPDYETLPGYSRFSRNHLTPEQIVSLVAARPLLFTPGSRWSYSNTGYVLLGMIVTRLSGISYASFLTRHVFVQLRMHDTGYDVNHPALPSHATGYVSGERVAPYIDMSVPYSAGALYSTASDLARWDNALLSSHSGIAPRSAIRQMFHPWVQVVPGHPGEGAYGYGWFIDEHGAEYDHDGLINGFVSMNAIFPVARADIIVLSNLQSADVRTITEHLAALIGLHAR